MIAKDRRFSIRLCAAILAGGSGLMWWAMVWGLMALGMWPQ